MPDTYQPDLPPGAPNYPASPLATSFGAFRASGQNDLASFLNPKKDTPKPVVLGEQPTGLAAHVASLGQRALDGLRNALGIRPDAPSLIDNRASSLEGDLDKLQARSTTIPNLYSQRAPLPYAPPITSQPKSPLPVPVAAPEGALNAFQLRALQEGKDRQASY